jgi:signal transduction histidine kinase/DNA-binding response OmpR family regulator
MPMKFPSINTRVLVIVGYCLLLALAMTGIVTIYLELVKLHHQNKDDSGLKKELIDLSNTLTTMYQSEGTASLLAFVENENLKLEYDSLTNRVFIQIDSLRITSTDSVVSQCLDTLSVLLEKKRKNAQEMFQLMKQINKDGIEEITKTTVIKGADMDNLNKLLANITKTKDDTVHVVSEKKSFFRRVADVVKSNPQDTVTQISKGSSSEVKELLVPIRSDTIIDFVRQVNKQTHIENAKIIERLINRQQELYTIKELTALQINKIMETMQEQEFHANLDILKNKNELLKRSTMLVAIVGLLALVVAIIFMSWILKSLSEGQRLHTNMQKAKKQAEILLKSREQLIYTITHDIKAPLSSIIGFLDLMSNDALSQKQQYYIGNMHSSASHILDLVRNLLDFHSMEDDHFQLTNVAFSPASHIRNIYDSFLPLAQKKEMTFELHSTLPETKTFLSDPYHIRQIVNNLLSNAIKFTQKKGEVSLITSLDEQNRWKILVQDSGPGIELADQANIFKEFFRIDETKEDMEGSGLGLPISKKLATLLGGTIEIESQKGKGALFTLVIPLVPLTEETVLKPDTAIDDSVCQILFVDDDRVQLNLLSELMKKEEWRCVCCLSAYEALDILKKKSFDIIFTDIQIPDMEGFELVKQIRKSDFPYADTVPVIAFSAGYLKSEDELKVAGFSGFLSKPFKSNQLLDIIEKHTTFKRKSNEPYRGKTESGWQEIIDFVSEDQEAAVRIIDSFIEETNKNREDLETAFQKKDKDKIKEISHKMQSLMRMISAHDIVSLLTDFEKGAISKEKGETLFLLLEETIKKAEDIRQMIDEGIIRN